MPGPPFSPWLRLAHVWRVPDGQTSGTGGLRRLLDVEFFLQLDGATWIALDDGTTIDLPPGHLAVIPPGLVHAWGHCPGAHLAVHADLHAQPRIEPMAMIANLARTVGPGRRTASWSWTLRLGGEDLLVPLVQRVDLDVWRALLAPLVDMYGARAHRSAASRLRAGAILSEAFARILATAGRPAGDPLLAQLAEAAASPEPPPVAALARRAGLGETAFRAAVRRLTGSSPRAHIERLRLDRAAYALRATDAPVARIAAEAGFADPFHFSRAFRRVFGRSPSRWRDG